MPRRLFLALLGLGVGLLGFELILQCLALVLWLGRDESAQPGGGRSVLCVGDSYTFGMGADDPGQESYPAVLGQRLVAQGVADVEVRKVARPSRNSREVAEALARALRERPAERVYVLAGMNDVWNPPSPLDRRQLALAEPGESFPLRFRTLRMLRFLLDWGGADPAALEGPSPELPFLGVWHDATNQLSITRVGYLVLNQRSMRWTHDGEVLRVETPSGEVAVDWRIDADHLVLSSALWTEPMRLQRGAGEQSEAQSRLLQNLDRIESIRAVLREHFVLMAEIVRAQGGEVVFLNYPWPSPGISDLPAMVAEELGAGFVDVEARFRGLQPVTDYAVEDNHCNTRGYAAFGELVAEDALRALNH